ncbi:MAG: protein kinase [Deltaproteobacteria bacterium]|nr:protein kinase [Deltaproteobacteria bacterium]
MARRRTRAAPERIVCPACEAPSPAAADRCEECGTELWLEGRFGLVEFLGAGGQGRTYRSMDRKERRQVAVKELSLACTRDWKTLELFRRSAVVLRGLSHPSIPKLVAGFELERSGVTFYYLVQDFIDGVDLSVSLREKRPIPEDEARRVLLEGLEILEYLHGRSPPVVHRDIKPTNLMRRSDGRLMLIDFDIVQDVLRPAGGSTVAVGTPGYAPLEQYVGLATTATDIHALGATVAALLAAREPWEMMAPGSHRVDFRPHVRVGGALPEVLERMLDPDVATRPVTVAAVREELRRADEAQEATRRRREKSAGERTGAAKRRWRTALAAIVALGGVIGMTELMLWLEQGPNAGQTGPAVPPAVGVAELGTMEGNAERRLIADGLGADWTRLDPVAALPWFTAAARSWRADAQPSKLEARHVRPDGTVDLTTLHDDENVDGEVDYEFAQPAASGEWLPGIRFELRGGTVTARSNTTARRADDTSTWLPAAPCGLAQAVAGLRRAAVLPARPYYDAELTPPWTGEDGPAGLPASWSLEAVAWQSGIPALARADTCEAVDQQGRPLPDPGWDEPVVRAGRVTDASGDAPVVVGTDCSTRVDHKWERGGGCSVAVFCGEGAWWEFSPACRVAERTVMGATDEHGAWVDGSPKLELDLRAGRAVVSEALPREYSVTIALEPTTDGR